MLGYCWLILGVGVGGPGLGRTSWGEYKEINSAAVTQFEGCKVARNTV